MKIEDLEKISLSGEGTTKNRLLINFFTDMGEGRHLLIFPQVIRRASAPLLFRGAESD